MEIKTFGMGIDGQGKSWEKKTTHIGAELDKQIYKEGESSWGLKEGFLDVVDVRETMKKVMKKYPCVKRIMKCQLELTKGPYFHCVNCSFRFNMIEEFGEALT